jgi:stalled ribosome rescue protein Dom34
MTGGSAARAHEEMEMETIRCLVWVDHHEARIVRTLAKGFDVVVVDGDDERPHERKHHGGHRHPLSARFADRIVTAIRDDRDLVVTGPSTAKDELLVHLRERHHELAARVSLVKTLDAATDGQLAARARELFERLDHMRGVHVPAVPS